MDDEANAQHEANGDGQPTEAVTPEVNGEAKPLFGKGSAFHGKKGRSGAPRGSKNAMKHGMQSNLRFGMRGGKLPAGYEYIELRCNELRRQVEDAVFKVKGEISLVDASAINSILRWERHGLLAAHWLRKEIDKLSASDRLRFSEAIAKASDNRDRNIKLLCLDRDRSQDVWGDIYRRDQPPLLPAPSYEGDSEVSGDDEDQEQGDQS